jgi:CxxC-x17-CxxC domain-containing protein
MSEFKKKFSGGGKPGGFSRGGSSRPSFGGDRGGARRPDSRGFDAPKELYKTSCAKCQNACEVPFRPNGMKPVYCKDCFVRDDERAPRDSFQKKSFGNDRPAYGNDRAPSRQASPEPDFRIGAILKELQAVHAKVDALSAQLSNTAYSSIISASADKVEKTEATKKMVKKTAPVKKAAKVAKKK